MIEVRVRNELSLDATLLGNFAPDQIPQLTTLFQTFTTYDGEYSGLRFEAAQFVFAEDGSIFFEIVVVDPSAA